MFDITSDSPMIDVHMYQLSSEVTITQSAACFLCILDGGISLTQSDCIAIELNAEDIFFLPSESVYRLKAQGIALLLYVEFHPYFLSHTLGFAYQTIHFDSRVYPSNGTNSFREDLATLATNFLSDAEDKQLMLAQNAYQILYHIVSAENTVQKSDVQLSKAERKLLKYKAFVENNYFRQLSLSQAAEYMDYTPQYLSNFLKSNLHMTFQEHINSIRLRAAVLLLKYSQETIHRISALCGFANASSFEHIFQKQFQQTPEEFQSSFQLPDFQTPPNTLKEVTSHSLMLDYLYNYMHFVPTGVLLHEEYISQTAKINVTRHTDFHKSWNQIINIGTASDFEKPLFRYALQILQENLHFQYGRCIEVLSLITKQTDNAQSYYNFSQVFDLLDYMRSIHLTPFIELINKPFHIYNDDERVPTDYRHYLDTANYDSFLYEVLPHFIRACISRYGYDEFSTWKFEVWRRYTPAMNSLEDSTTYTDRFQTIAGIMKGLVPELVIGGPGFNTFLHEDNFYELMRGFNGKAFQPDFVSAYYFPYSPKEKDNPLGLTGYTAFSCNTMSHKIDRLRQHLLELHMEHLPFYITEYSSFLSTGNYISDSPYPGLFIIQQVLDNYGRVDCLSYWLACDISLAYQNYSAPLFGGNGILSKDGIPKSCFYAFDFLNQLGNQLIAMGDHFIAACSENHVYQILVFYPAVLNQTFSTSLFSQELLQFPYSAFEDVPPLDFRLQLNHMASGNYLIKTQSLNITHGNILEAWRNLNYMKDLRTSEIHYLRQASAPAIEMKLEQIEQSYLLQAILNRNEAVLFTLEQYQ